MKKYIYIMCSLCAALACTNEYMAPGMEPSHSVVYTSEMDFGNRVQVNGTMTFGDVSPGIVSRKWTFPENVDVLESTNDAESEKGVVKATFMKAGTFEVKLNQTFSQEAFANGRVSGTTADTTIIITVLDSVKVNFEAMKLSNEGKPAGMLNVSNLAKNEVEAGKFIELSPLLIGEPETVTWIVEGASPSTITSNEKVSVKYKKVGTYDVTLIAFRNRPFGGDTIVLKEFVKVIPSSDPVTLDAVENRPNDRNVIALNFSRDMDAQTLKPSDFTVNLMNGEKQIGANVTSLKLDPAQENVVLLTLSSKVYDNDIANVSFKGGVLKTSDGVAAKSFTDRAVVFSKTNILVQSPFDHSMENSEDTNWPYLFWGGQWEKYKLNISKTVAHTGSRSAKIEMQPGGGMIIGHNFGSGKGTFNVKAGKTYEIGFWLKVESLGNSAAGKEDPNIIFFWNPNTNWGTGRYTFTADTPVGEWTYVRASFAEFNADGAYDFMIRGFNGNNDKPLTFYMDDISVAEVSLRP